MPAKPTFDKLFEQWVVPHTCGCCEKCWLIVEGKRAGKCVCGGPYRGYVEVPDRLPAVEN